jgi:2'-5' RNA ligase
MNNLHRIFIAINLPERLRKEIYSYQDRWLSLPAKWTRAENLHITLSFLGNVNDQEVCDICRIAAEVAKRHEPFELMLDRIFYGPKTKWPPRMVWLGGAKSAQLGALQKDFESALFEFSGGDYHESGEYEFSPHITLARIEQFGLKKMEEEEIPQIDEKISRSFSVETIEVMESEMKRGGPQYAVLESVVLGE